MQPASALGFLVLVVAIAITRGLSPKPGRHHSSYQHAVRVACVGDSITRGWTGDDFLPGYPAALQDILGSGYDVQNFGACGMAALKSPKYSFWTHPQFHLAMAAKPDIVVLMLGTNDATAATGMNFVQFTQEFEADYIALIKKFQELPSSPRVLVAIPPPMYAPIGHAVRHSRNMTLINHELPAWIPRLANIASVEPAVDVFTAWRDHCPDWDAGVSNCDWIDDQRFYVHPNQEGFHQIALVVGDAIVGKTS